MMNALSLDKIIQFEIPPIFRREDSPKATLPEPKPKIGIFGNSGEGKSMLMAIVSHIDFQLVGDKSWSNIKIKYTWSISNEIAAEYGLRGGPATFESERFIAQKMYRMDPSYRRGCFALDEINVDLADALKFNTNANFYLNQADQQMRKDQNGLVYTSIHEMWVDPRVREITDIMVKIGDQALSPTGIAERRPRGENFEFFVYPMTRYLTGRTWVDHGEKLGPYYLHAKNMWNIFDTYKKQATGKIYARSNRELLGPENGEVGENQPANREYGKWGWLYAIIQSLHRQGIQEITSANLWDLIGTERIKMYDKGQIGSQLTKMGIQRKGYSGSRYSPLKYVIESFDIDENPEEETAGRRV